MSVSYNKNEPMRNWNRGRICWKMEELAKLLNRKTNTLKLLNTSECFSYVQFRLYEKKNLRSVGIFLTETESKVFENELIKRKSSDAWFQVEWDTVLKLTSIILCNVHPFQFELCPRTEDLLRTRYSIQRERTYSQY